MSCSTRSTRARRVFCLSLRSASVRFARTSILPFLGSYRNHSTVRSGFYGALGCPSSLVGASFFRRPNLLALAGDGVFARLSDQEPLQGVQHGGESRPEYSDPRPRSSVGFRTSEP